MYVENKEAINKLISSKNIPIIFKSVLNKQFVFAKDEEILYAIFIEREYQNNLEKYGNIHSRAKMVLATSFGLIILEEGEEKSEDSIVGFKIQYVLYSKISGVELDTCLLAGSLVIHTEFSSKRGIEMNFNTARYQHEFKKIIEIIRNKQIDILFN